MRLFRSFGQQIARWLRTACVRLPWHAMLRLGGDVVSRLINQEIPPWTRDAKGAPASFRWRNRSYRVAAVLEDWTEAGAWWDQEPERRIWRVQVGEGGVWELAETADGQGRPTADPPKFWVLVVYD